MNTTKQQHQRTKQLKPKPKIPRGEESYLQEKCVNWFRLRYRGHLLFSIPNGGFRKTSIGAKMKREGMLKGASDLLLLHPSKGYHALCIEFKVGDNDLSAAQLKFATQAMESGYLFRVVRDFDGFRDLVNWYLEST